MFPALGSPLDVAALEVASRTLFHLDVSRLEESSSGLLVAVSGHTGAFSRGTTLAGVLDALGVSYTAVNAQPAYEMRADASGAMRLGLRMGTSDRLVFDNPPLAQELTGLLEFVETGGVTGTAGATLFAICNDALTGARLWIDTTGGASGFYRINFHNGSTSVSATVNVRPTTGQRVRLWFTWSAAGVMTLRQSINEGADVTATSAALAIPANGVWGTGARIRVNRRGDTENPSQACYFVCKLVASTVSLDFLQRVR